MLSQRWHSQEFLTAIRQKKDAPELELPQKQKNYIVKNILLS